MTSFEGVRPLLDEIELGSGESDPLRIVAKRRFPEQEPFFAGHFPGAPVVPGVFVLEAFAECARRFLADRFPSAAGSWVLLEVPAVRFRRRVLPGDTLELTVVPTGTEGAVHRFEATAAIAGQRAVQSVLHLGRFGDDGGEPASSPER